MVRLTVPLADGRLMVFEGTEEEVMNIARVYDVGAGGPIATHARLEIVEWTEPAARTFWGLLHGDQAQLIRFLLHQGGAAKYSELLMSMGYEEQRQRLGAVLSAIKRNAKKATQMSTAEAVRYRAVPNGYEYFIDRKALPFLRDLDLRERVQTLLQSMRGHWITMEAISAKIGADIGPYPRILGPMEADGDIVEKNGYVRWRTETFEIVTNAAPFDNPHA